MPRPTPSDRSALVPASASPVDPDRVPTRHLAWLMVGVAGLTAGWAALAIPARATDAARTTADEPQYLLTARSLVDDGDLDLADELDERSFEPFHEVSLDPQTVEGVDGRRVSPHDPLLPVILAPAMGAGGWVAAKATLALIAGVLAAALTWVAVRRFDVASTSAAVTVLAFTLTAPLAPYGTQVYPELPAALLLTLAVGLLTGPLRRGSVAGLGLVLVALPWLGLKYAPVGAALAVLGAVRLWRRGRLADLVGLSFGLLLAGVVFLVAHLQWYGGWTVYASGDHFQQTGELSVVGSDPDVVARSRRLVGLVVDRGFGLAAWSPLYLLTAVALGGLLRRRPRGWDALVVPLATGWATATWVALTMHGWWWPGRQVVVVAPALVLATAWWVGRVRSRRTWVVVAGMVGVVLWGWLLTEVLSGRLTLIVEFEETADPLYRLWRTLLPDGRSGGSAADALLLVWSALLVGLGALGWRSARRPGGSVAGDQDAAPGELADADVPSADLDGDGAVG